MYLAQRDKDSPHPTTQSDPDSQTARPQARNNASGCNAAPSHSWHTGFVGGKAGMRYPLPWFLLSDGLLKCKNKTRVHAFGHTYYVRATVCLIDLLNISVKNI